MNLPILSQDTLGFLNHTLFDEEVYELLKSRIEKNPKLEMTQKSLILLLSNSMFEIGIESMSNGLFYEFLSRANTFRDQFCSGRTSEAKAKRIIITFLIAQAYLAQGSLSHAYEYLLDSNDGYGFTGGMEETFRWVEQYWTITCFLIFNLIGFKDSENNICIQSKKQYGRFRIRVDRDDISSGRVLYEIMLFGQGDLTKKQLHIPWLINFEISLGRNKNVEFTAVPITLSDYKRKFYNYGESFESQRKLIQSYGVHSS